MSAQADRLKNALLENGSMVHSPSRKLKYSGEGRAPVQIGHWVNVDADYSTGKCSDGGIGMVYEVDERENSLFITV